MHGQRTIIMQRRADLKEGMDRFTIGLFQYKAFFVFLSLLFKSKCHKLEITF